MYVKELSIRGFKSFSNATTMRFEPGITAIVGPNGSGKSNIVDALSWVMGEQGAKSLRGTSMEDVIFAGTSTRPPLGRAQVSLTIDNTDGTLDIDYSEVTISRTIFRNGGSEYAINGSPVRLLDIQELLSDTGLGSHMHVIVGQGRLDSILRATPEDNRAFIEEAAGILKHRKRKERALRKLKGTQENIDRLDDLLKEIQRQLGPLRRQARVSRRADAIQVALRDSAARILADDAEKLNIQREQVHSELAQVRHDLAEQQQALTRIKLSIENLESLTSQSSPAINAINQTFNNMSRIEERLKSLSALATEREHSWRNQIVEVGGDNPDILNKRADELETQAQQSEELVSDARLVMDSAIEKRAGLEKQLAQTRQLITELRKTAQERNAHISSIRELIAREEGKVQTAISRQQDITAQKASFVNQLEEAQSRLNQLTQQRDSDTDTDEKFDDQLTAVQNELDATRERRDEAQEQHRNVESRIISLRAKADALNGTLESRNTSGDLERHSAINTLGHIAEYIHIEDGWEEAISRALGPFASAVIVPNAGDTLEAIKFAATQKMGRAVILHPTKPMVLNGLTITNSTNNANGSNGMNGSHSGPVPQVKSAGSVISVNPSAADIRLAQGLVTSVQVLVEDVALVEDLAAAHQILQTYEHISCVIDSAGEMVTRVGAIGGSSKSPSDLSLVARRDKALEECKQLEIEVEKLSAQVEKEQSEYSKLREQLDAVKSAITERKVRAQQRERDITAARNSVSSIEKRVSDLTAHLEEITEEQDNHKITLQDLEAQLGAASQAQEQEFNIDDTMSRERDLDSQLAQAREKEVSAKIQWNDVRHRSESLARQAVLLRDNAKQAVIRRNRVTQQNERRAMRAGECVRISQLASLAAQSLNSRMSIVTQRRVQLQQEASLHDEELGTLRSQRNELEPRVSALQKQEHDLDVTRERVSTQFGQITQKSLDDFGLSVDNLIANYGPSLPVPVLDDDGRFIPLEKSDSKKSEPKKGEPNFNDSEESLELSDAEGLRENFQTVAYNRDEQQKRLEKARRDLAALGKVNPLATEEYDALQTRNQYLSEQRNDVLQSRDDLMSLIKDLDETMVEVFRGAFDDTAEAFQKMFATLFPGGTGRLRLENPDDLLTSGVIVEASPAGKRVKQLTLLSGGERSLTALALLFAIFTARPSPFYIMDEVEAALDDINLTRLLNAMNELRLHAQLIVITHQQRTMSIADALYGVTMRSDGVTAVVSQNLRRGVLKARKS